MQESKINILGCPVDVLTMEGALERIAAALARRQNLQVVTANAEMIYAARHNPRLFLALHDAGLVTADGMGVVLASRILGQPLPERVAGVDLVYQLLRRGSKEGWSFYLLGAKVEVLEAAQEQLLADFPHLQIAGSHHGYFQPETGSTLLENIKLAKPDILLVALGAPRQDLWLHENLAKSGARVGIGVGGTFDILAGKVKRAPLWMQGLGLEWLFRLGQEPSRWRRMLALPKFVGAVLWQRFRGN